LLIWCTFGIPGTGTATCPRPGVACHADGNSGVGDIEHGEATPEDLDEVDDLAGFESIDQVSERASEDQLVRAGTPTG
jgi:hypothetical protein